MLPARRSENQTGIAPPGRGRMRSAAPPMMKEPASVTMIAGRCRRTTISPETAPMPRPATITAAAPPSDAERAGHRGRGDHRAEADQRADGEADAAGQHQDRLRHRDQREREPALGELRDAADAEEAGEEVGVEGEEAEDDDEEGADAAVPLALDAPVEPGAGRRGCCSRRRPRRIGGHRRADDRLLADRGALEHARRSGPRAPRRRGRRDGRARACRSSTGARPCPRRRSGGEARRSRAWSRRRRRASDR